MFFSRCLAVPSVVASGGFSSPSVYLAQVLFRNEVECRASGSSACTYLHRGRQRHPPPLRGGVTDSGDEDTRSGYVAGSGRVGLWRGFGLR